MAKYVTPEMEKINSKRLNRKGEIKKSTPMRESWKRLRRNRTAVLGMCVIILLFIIAIFADLIAPYDYSAQDYNALGVGPNSEHLFGTDQTGRDIFSRCIYGTRYSLPIGLLCVITSVLTGGTLGVISAYVGGRVDDLIMRIMDIFQAIPGTLLTIALVSSLGSGMSRLILAITISFMPACAKTCRAAIFTVKGNEYVESSRAIGVGGARMMVRHLIPNAVGPIIIFAVGMVSAAILVISTLSYVGIGIVPPTPEWGAMLSAGKEYISSGPHMVIFPGLMIMITIFAFNLFGDGLRDALDPRLK